MKVLDFINNPQKMLKPEIAYNGLESRIEHLKHSNLSKSYQIKNETHL